MSELNMISRADCNFEDSSIILKSRPRNLTFMFGDNAGERWLSHMQSTSICVREIVHNSLPDDTMPVRLRLCPGSQQRSGKYLFWTLCFPGNRANPIRTHELLNSRPWGSLQSLSLALLSESLHQSPKSDQFCYSYNHNSCSEMFSACNFQLPK